MTYLNLNCEISMDRVEIGKELWYFLWRRSLSKNGAAEDFWEPPVVRAASQLSFVSGMSRHESECVAQSHAYTSNQP